eukprot:TRINITY_DN6598_c0_g1_i1.p1 TRINITY_DN6598_c0_g1~~TRINITY_DN6598_c0_g1_i1.p1  ORF type:complete len:348 (-),score=91.57 TRINITY_DN6598_c0_g1_i1:32-1048(-)
MGGNQSGGFSSFADLATRYAKANNFKRLHMLIEKHKEELKQSKMINFRIDASGNTLLNFLCSNSQYVYYDFIQKQNIEQLVILLIQEGIDVNLTNFHGSSPLCNLTRNCQSSGPELNLVQILLENGAQIYPSTLIAAITNANITALELLIEHGGDKILNKPDESGKTPLYYSVLTNNEEILSHLIENGADVTCRDSESNLTPFLKARQMEQNNECFNLGLSKLLDDHMNKKLAEIQVVDNLSLEHSCKICWERKIDVVIIKCGHVAICKYCSVKLLTCPICCGTISKIHKVILPSDVVETERGKGKKNNSSNGSSNSSSNNSNKGGVELDGKTIDSTV